MTGKKLTHLDEKGAAHMVDVSEKNVTHRKAVAAATIEVGKEAFAAVIDGKTKKGDVLATVRIAAIMGAKQTSNLIPLCHPLFLSKISVDIEGNADKTAFTITATVETDGKTGVEMEALTAASLGALTLYDMIKAIARDAIIKETRLIHKSGGKSGDYNVL